jgi:hypothetical protein
MKCSSTLGRTGTLTPLVEEHFLWPLRRGRRSGVNSQGLTVRVPLT